MFKVMLIEQLRRAYNCQVLGLRLDLGHMRSIDLELSTPNITGVYIAKLDSGA